MDIGLVKEEVTKELWQAYIKTPEYKSSPAAIPSHHSLVEKQEKIGLEKVVTNFIHTLQTENNVVENFKNRSISDFLLEWKSMNKMLFQSVLKDCGDWRKTDVRFGDWEDCERYRIPKWQEVSSQISNLAHEMPSFITRTYKDEDDKYMSLAYVHYEFVRIHPFRDGNGRIARVISDQLSVFLGLLPAMGGYPRRDKKRRESYHKAIKSCIDDPTCFELSQWISGYISEQLYNLA